MMSRGIQQNKKLLGGSFLVLKQFYFLYALPFYLQLLAQQNDKVYKPLNNQKTKEWA